jgi:hypothetical protein
MPIVSTILIFPGSRVVALLHNRFWKNNPRMAKSVAMALAHHASSRLRLRSSQRCGSDGALSFGDWLGWHWQRL